METKGSVVGRQCSSQEKWGVSRCKSVEGLEGVVLCTSEDREEGQDALVYAMCDQRVTNV